MMRRPTCAGAAWHREDDLSNLVIDIESELAVTRPTTVQGLCASLEQFEQYLGEFKSGGLLAAKHVAAIRQSIANGVTPGMILPELQGHLEQLGDLVECLDNIDCCDWCDGIEIDIESLIEGKLGQSAEGGLDPAEAERRLAKLPPIVLDVEPGEDPEIVSLFQQYVEAERVHERALDDTEEDAAAQHRRDEVVQALGCAPARSLMGAALKAFAILLYNDDAVGARLHPIAFPPEWPDEEPCGSDALNVGFVRDLQRLIPGLSPLIAPAPPRVAA
jgi:hypothetical protein